MKKIYQTLEDNGKKVDVEKNGPFECTRPNAWLYNGFYFWDEDIELGHWWGKFGYNNNYMICESRYKYDPNLCWDLHNEHSAREEFREIVKGIKARKINNGRKIKVRDIIEELFKRKIMKYDAVRLSGLNSIGQNDNFSNTITLDIRNKNVKGKMRISEASLDLRPAIQICFYKKDALDRQGFDIVFPKKYVQNNDMVF